MTSVHPEEGRLQEHAVYLDTLIQNHRALPARSHFWWGTHRFVVRKGVFNPALADSSILFADYIASLDLTGKVVVDAGTGTGLVSISALQAGARHVIAYDCILEAAENALENVSQIGEGHRVGVYHSPRFPLVDTPVDYVFANPPFYEGTPPEPWMRAFYDPDRTFLEQVAKEGQRVLKPGGRLVIISGLQLGLETVVGLLNEAGLVHIREETVHPTRNMVLTITSAARPDDDER